jgi:broad specificity phosphatase PhoE
VIRHGERADKIPGLKYRNHVDPPLTQMGLLQAEFTGRYFKDLFEKSKFDFDKVIIETSPFLRCLMTSGQIA